MPFGVPNQTVPSALSRIDATVFDASPCDVPNVLNTPLLEPTDATAERASPHCTVARLVHGVNTVLRESIGLGEAVCREGSARGRSHPRQSAALPADPHLGTCAGNRIDHVVIQSGDADALDCPVVQQVQATAGWRDPYALCGVDVDRARLLRQAALEPSSPS